MNPVWYTYYLVLDTSPGIVSLFELVMELSVGRLENVRALRASTDLSTVQIAHVL